MFKFLFIIFLIIYICYKLSSFFLKKVIKTSHKNFNSSKNKKDSILDKEGEYVDYEELD